MSETNHLPALPKSPVPACERSMAGSAEAGLVTCESCLSFNQLYSGSGLCSVFHRAKWANKKRDCDYWEAKLTTITEAMKEI